MIEDWLARFPDRDSAIAALDKERVPCAPVLSLQEAINHPHMRARKTVRRVKDRSLGEIDLPSMPVKFSSWPDRTDLKASTIGEDNEAILHEVLDLTDGEIAQLYTDEILIKAPAAATVPAGAS